MLFLSLEKQKQATSGSICFKFDSKKTEVLLPRCQKGEENILTIIKEPNSGSDALVDFKPTGKTGKEVGETVWQVVQESKSQKTLLATGSDGAESSPTKGPHPYLEQKLGYSLQRIFCGLHSVSIG